MKYEKVVNDNEKEVLLRAIEHAEQGGIAVFVSDSHVMVTRTWYALYKVLFGLDKSHLSILFLGVDNLYQLRGTDLSKVFLADNCTDGKINPDNIYGW